MPLRLPSTIPDPVATRGWVSVRCMHCVRPVKGRLRVWPAMPWWSCVGVLAALGVVGLLATVGVLPVSPVLLLLAISLVFYIPALVLEFRGPRATFDRSRDRLEIVRGRDRFAAPLSSLDAVLFREEGLRFSYSPGGGSWHVWAIWLDLRGAGYRFLLQNGDRGATRRIAAAIAAYASVPLDTPDELP